MFRKRWAVGAIGLLVLPIVAVPAQAIESVGTVSCAAVDGSYSNSRSMLFALLEPREQGADLLIVDEMGQSILSLDQDGVVTAASSLNSQSLSPWNLVAYDQTPVSLDSDGNFKLQMMVSSRSSCMFEGRAVVLPQSPQ